VESNSKSECKINGKKNKKIKNKMQKLNKQNGGVGRRGTLK